MNNKKQLFMNHLNRFIAEIEKHEVECALITNTSNIFYLTGFQGAATLIVCEGTPILYVPVLEFTRARKNVSKNIDVIAYSKYPLKNVEVERYIQKDILSIVKEHVKKREKIGVEKGSLTIQTFEKLRETLGEREFINITEIIWKLRTVKDNTEIEYMRKAISISEESYLKTLRLLSTGLSELEVAGILERHMRERGAEDYAFPTIVAFEENAAYPHAQPTTRVLHTNNIVLIDWGSKFNGYCSDMTRTIYYGQNIPEEILRVLEIVKNAQEEAIDHIEPGVKASEIDAIARNVLNRANLSRYFIHGLGHGVGIDVHEPPYLTPGSKDTLEPGMIVTVEPGIYIEGKYGVRIEDMVLVTEKGRKVLTNIDKIIHLM